MERIAVKTKKIKRIEIKAKTKIILIKIKKKKIKIVTRRIEKKASIIKKIKTKEIKRGIYQQKPTSRENWCL